MKEYTFRKIDENLTTFDQIREENLKYVKGEYKSSPYNAGSIFDMNIEKLTKINEKIITTCGQSNISTITLQQKSFLFGYMQQEYYDKFCEFMKKYDKTIYYHIFNKKLKLYTTNRKDIQFEILTREANLPNFNKRKRKNYKDPLNSISDNYCNHLGFGIEKETQAQWKNSSFTIFRDGYPCISFVNLFKYSLDEVFEFEIISAEIFGHDMQDIVLEFLYNYM